MIILKYPPGLSFDLGEISLNSFATDASCLNFENIIVSTGATFNREIKKTCDILIDQIGDSGGWGYGMNSVESMKLGLCCMSEMNAACNKFFKDNPSKLSSKALKRASEMAKPRAGTPHDWEDYEKYLKEINKQSDNN